MAEELVTLFSRIKIKVRTYLENLPKHHEYVREREEYEDDAWRHYLKEVSSFSFPRVFSHGPAYMLLTHLHSLTGKCPYTEEQIISDVTTWVKPELPDGSKKNLDATQVEETLDRLFSKWYRGEANGALAFEDYCNDFIRWGTSGGAKKSDINGETYRTKWAWAYSRSTASDGSLIQRDLYNQSLLEGASCAFVALKEEAQKTREIITTPMPSYLRQCYLLYR